MTREDFTRRLLVACLVGALAVVSGVSPAAPAPPTSRWVYVTVVDEDGLPVGGLTPADFEVKEGGKIGEVVSVEPAGEKIRLALMVEEGLTPYLEVRLGLVEFMRRMSPVAQISLIVVTFRNNTVVEFTSNLNRLIQGVNEFPLAKRLQVAQVPEAVSDMARVFEKSKPVRPAIVLLAFDVNQEATSEAEAILTRLAKSGAHLSAVTNEPSTILSSDITTLRDSTGRSQVIGDGTRQSGGRHITVLALSRMQTALGQIADDLTSQHLIKYVLPGSARPSDRISVKLKKPGLTLRAPSRVPK